MLAVMDGHMVDVVHLNWGARSKEEAEKKAREVKKLLEEKGFKVLEVYVDHAIRGYWTPFFTVAVMTVDEWNAIHPQGYEEFGKLHRKLKEVLRGVLGGAV